MLFPSRSKSFTLLELLIVIGILAVLSTALI
ncbi:MAG: prepilin-type N-terminal cleavage/methylation domain-containing protein, partial [Candidatus Pacebacteria bacterium]|nr:prepilin-type N-terminal cleavage/methylation domain-containing protein [Candidatus Paceibacterota bacterium]